ncbi:reverse transcriptase-like protein [Oceanobacillus sp. 1P07AA]|uniref:reverse transcriptase-like protein n=1 Tax=Oceanobacillus sp. 1P07AA TaxID=3132293 RepID=UPI0039A4CA17
MIEVYTDGATLGNPGIGGAGIYIKDGKQSYQYSISLSTMSNHEAEFHAIIHGLQLCKKHFPNEILSFRTDSKVAADSIERGYTKNKLFQGLLHTINQISSEFPFFFIKWIPEKQNNHADKLAKKAIQHHS